MSTVVTETTECRICHSTNLIEILNLGQHVISSRFPYPDESDPISSPLILIKCDDSENENNCGLVQLKHQNSADELYCHHYGYRSGLNRTMTQHLQSLVKEIESRVTLAPNDIVLDIGSNDATLLKSYQKQDQLQFIGIDPTGNQFKDHYTENIKLVVDFFTKDAFQSVFGQEKASVVTSIAMFYDLPDPVAFMKDIKDILKPDGIWVFEQSYLPTMLQKKSFDTVCHEHLEYYALKQIEWMTNQVGLKIIDVALNEANGGSFRITVTHQTSQKHRLNTENINKLIEFEKELGLDTLEPYLKFQRQMEQVKHYLVTFIREQHSHGKTFYLYGASTKGNTLLQYYNLDHQIITAAAERNPEKYGRVTPKTRIPIESEADVRASRPDYMIVLPWHFKEEFLERETEYLAQGGQFLFPLPEMELVSKRRILITGIQGQIGQYLVKQIRERYQNDVIIYGLVRKYSKEFDQSLHYLECDIKNLDRVEEIIRMVRPEQIYNLAGQTDAVVSIERPEETIIINGLVVTRICETIRQMGGNIQFFQACSSELFKGFGQLIVDETNLNFYPKNPYAIGKLSAYWTVRYYREKYGLQAFNGIIFNTESPLRRVSYVTRKITHNAFLINQKQISDFTIGNIESRRDWIHADDVAKAMLIIMESTQTAGIQADDYIISSGNSHSIKEFIDETFNNFDCKIRWKHQANILVGVDEQDSVLIKQDPNLVRKYETQKEEIIGNNSKLRQLGWEPTHTFEDLVEEMCLAEK